MLEEVEEFKNKLVKHRNGSFGYNPSIHTLKSSQFSEASNFIIIIDLLVGVCNPISEGKFRK